MKTKNILALPLFLIVAACANTGSSYTPIVDGRRDPTFNQDLAACRHAAQDRKWMNGETKQNMAVGAGIGALLGAADNEGDRAEDMIGGAVAGVIGGGLAGAVQSNKDRKAIVIECMKQRGHRVVG